MTDTERLSLESFDMMMLRNEYEETATCCGNIEAETVPCFDCCARRDTWTDAINAVASMDHSQVRSVQNIMFQKKPKNGGEFFSI